MAVTGYGLVDSNRVVVLSAGSCGSDDMVAVDTWGLLAPAASDDGTTAAPESYSDDDEDTYSGTAAPESRLLEDYGVEEAQLLADYGADGAWLLAQTGARRLHGDASAYAFGTPLPPIAPGQFYKVCWSHDGTQLADFKVEIDAEAEMVGPVAAELDCILGQPCSVGVDGFGLAASNRIVPIAGDVCGGASAVVAGPTPGPATWLETAPAAVDGATSTYDFGESTSGQPGDHYRLCWSHDGGGLADFKVELDADAILRGPFMDNWNCTMGIQCEIVVDGFGLVDTSSIVALSAGDCGAEDAEVAADQWQDAVVAARADDGSQSTYDLGRVVRGLPGPIYKICWAHNPLSLADYKVELDTDFGLKGPYRSDHECALGHPCDVPISGWAFEDFNSLVLVHGGECGDPLGSFGMADTVVPASLNYPPVVLYPNRTHADYTLGDAIVGFIGNMYKLCWSWDPIGNIGGIQDTLPNFPVEVDNDFAIKFINQMSTSSVSSVQQSGGLRGIKSELPYYTDPKTGLDKLVLRPPELPTSAPLPP
jgi:hypothetical protein